MYTVPYANCREIIYKIVCEFIKIYAQYNSKTKEKYK